MSSAHTHPRTSDYYTDEKSVLHLALSIIRYCYPSEGGYGWLISAYIIRTDRFYFRGFPCFYCLN